VIVARAMAISLAFPAAPFSLSVLYEIVMVAVGLAGVVVWLLTGRQRAIVGSLIEPPRQDFP
jgi:hypothetical protein